MLKVAIICGGPSLERGISLNSARSVLDHLSSDQIEVVPFYLDESKTAYAISPSQLYSNTPSDFDFKLTKTGTRLNKKQFISALKQTDIVFPVMHGPFGEDGTIQRFLESHKIPFVGSNARTCRLMFDKYDANEFIRKNGFYAPPSEVLKIYHTDHAQIIEKFFTKNKITRAIVKPANGGSSIGVFSVSTPKEALEKSEIIFSKRMDTRVVIEPFMTGTEFTAIILQNKFDLPVCILPTEIETDYTENQIFDYRKKYLPTRQVTWHCPPRFSNEVIERIQVQAEQLFALLKINDFARLDGWLTPEGDIWFSDFNPISGMEQNSFIFQQTSRVGMTHADALRYIVKNACRRQNIPFPESSASIPSSNKKEISVLFGGSTSERQVSLMSGTNAWLKLLKSKKYAPKPYLLDLDNETVWHLPYSFALNHTVEEISNNCQEAGKANERLHYLLDKVKLRLALDITQASQPDSLPTKQSLSEFISNSGYIFLGLHGGLGEDGTLQGIIQNAKKPFNGSTQAISAICIDKAKTAEFIKTANIPGVAPIKEKMYQTSMLLEHSQKTLEKLWLTLKTELNSRTFVIKPNSDGCSSGVAHVFSPADLSNYLSALKSNAHFIPKDTLTNQSERIELSVTRPEKLLIQSFIETDKIKVVGSTLRYKPLTNLLETTIGVLEHKGFYHALSPSITIAFGDVLSVEEKFQGGTGINITPPPTSIISQTAQKHACTLIEQLSAKIGIKGYARVDAFVNTNTGELIIIEVNTLPALTPSTVLFHQALAEEKPIYPTELLETIIQSSHNS